MPQSSCAGTTSTPTSGLASYAIPGHRCLLQNPRWSRPAIQTVAGKAERESLGTSDNAARRAGYRAAEHGVLKQTLSPTGIWSTVEGSDDGWRTGELFNRRYS